MTITMLDNDRVQAWLNQFAEGDRKDATVLLSVTKLVSADEFAEAMMQLLENRLKSRRLPIAIYNETERGHRKGVPHRLFNETKTKIRRATGNVGPALVPRQRYIGEQVGSEGVLATLLTQFQKANSSKVILSPGPDTIRTSKVRRFILVTDFIGSGQRVERFLEAAWRVRSVRAWWSRRTKQGDTEKQGWSFEIVAFSGTEHGIKRVKSHPCQPDVYIAVGCPTIRTIFPPAQAAIIERLCTKYVPTGLSDEALGYGGSGALIGFAHSMPNNAPAILCKKFRKWIPLFPSRVATSVGSPFVDGATKAASQKRLEAAIGLQPSAEGSQPITAEAIVLSALRRSPRNIEAISGRLGLEIETVESALAKLRNLQWINNRNQITDRGRLALKRLADAAPSKLLPKTKPSYYFPKSLRVPNGV